jgi:aspartate dehydrogenase
MPRTVGIIGCGTIGTEIALAIDQGRIKNAMLGAVFDIVEKKASDLASRLQSRPAVYSDFDQFVSSDIDLIVEAASQDAVRKFVYTALVSGKDAMIMSVGALADSRLLSSLLSAAGNARTIYIPAGAIAGIDAVKSSRHLLESVALTTTKNPKALAGAPFFANRKIDPESIREKKVIYEGSAADAVREFPSNVNVAAVLSLAGIGIDKTVVRVVADPDTNVNQHEIVAKGKSGEIYIMVRNVPSPENPKTSFLAVLSAIECLQSACGGVLKIGS